MELNKNIEDFDLVFLDLETTGLDVITGDAICEIGAFKVRKRKIIDKFHSLINPKKNIPKEAFSVHKISDEELKNAPCFEEVADEFILFLENCVICAYNVEFDMGFIRQHLKRIDYTPLSLPAIDILSMARDVLKLPQYNLEIVAKFFNVDCSHGLHRALDDALVAYEVFYNLLSIFEERDVKRLDEFVSLYGLNNDIFRSKVNQKIYLLKQAIENKRVLKIRYFSQASTMNEEKILPLRVFQEDKYFYLLCQGQAEASSRIKLNRILEVEAI